MNSIFIPPARGRHGAHRMHLPFSMTFLGFLLLASVTVAPPVFADTPYWIYTVRPGDTIWDLTEKHCTSVLYWKRIQKLNGIDDSVDKEIPPGTKLRFPVAMLKQQPASAQVLQVSGEVQMVHFASGAESDVSTDTELRSGDRLFTGKNSNATIQFADESEMLVLAESEVIMDKLSAYGSTGMVDTRIRLQRGQVDTQVRPSKGPGSRYRITTPAAVAAVRGTDFRVSAEADAARSEVLEGKVAVEGEASEQLVPAGYGVIAKAGEAVAEPKELLPAPDLSATPELLQRLPLQFVWNKQAGAEGFRFQIAPDDKFDRLLADANTPTNRGFLTDLPDGEYSLRVRAVDAEGLEGHNALHRFTVDARPEPPLITTLSNAEVTRDPQPEFGWTQSESAKHYRLQLAADEQFSDLLFDSDGLTDSGFRPQQELAPNTYFWRMASIDAQGEQGPYSDTQSFEYKPVPPNVAPEPPKVSDKEMMFTWPSAGDSMQYQIQMADNAKFSSPVLDQTTDATNIIVPRPAPATYYVRIRSIDESGYAGPYGSTQQVTVQPTEYWPWLLLLLPLVL